MKWRDLNPRHADCVRHAGGRMAPLAPVLRTEPLGDAAMRPWVRCCLNEITGRPKRDDPLFGPSGGI